MLILIALVLAISSFIIFHFHTRKTKIERNIYPPGPLGLPFIGNLHQFDANYPHIYLWRLAQKYGPIMSMKLGYRKVIVVSSADVVKEIIKSHDLAFSSRPNLTALHKYSYNELDIMCSPYNEIWRETRKICTLHLFTVKQVQSFRPIRENEILRLMEKIENNLSLSKVNNLSKMMMSMTSNAICRVAFGKDYEKEGYESKRFYELFHECQAIVGGFFVSDFLPRMGWIDKISGMMGRLEKNFSDFDTFYNQLIDEHMDVANRPKLMDGDILDILLELRRNKSYLVDLTLDHVKAILVDILIAGTETSASLVVWAMTALMRNANVMKKAQAEIRNSIGKKDFVSENDTLNLKYLSAVVKETLRLYPPTPLLVPRETWQMCTLQGYEIQPGTLVYINGWGISRDPKIWRNPNDFIPERFFELDINVAGRNPELTPFGIGRRGCPGMFMGLTTAENVLANLIYKFNWELPNGMKEDDIDFDVLPGLVMHKKKELCLLAKPI